VSDVTREELERRLGEVPLFDVRTRAEYDGSTGYPCDPRQGHIAGAVHLDLSSLVSRPPDDVRALVGLPDGAEVVVYCHSGSRSAMAAEILRVAGYDARNYAGSWHEWSDTDLPAEAEGAGGAA
jgi:thiosulfate/3-mercaptopyruvate sulfurtransferase